jgi:hypothetical protein
MSLEKKDPFDQLLKNHLSASLSRPPADSCPDENRIVAYLEGSQGEPFKKSFEQHLLQCDRCQSEMASLLKSGVMEAQPQPVTKAASASPRGNLLALLFGWTSMKAFRPVFAILLVSVVTGVVGYRLIREDRVLQERPLETAESAQRKNSAGPDTGNFSTAPSVDNLKPQEEKPSLKVEAPPRRESAQDGLEGGMTSQTQSTDPSSRAKTNRQDGEMKDAFAAEPPQAAPTDLNRNTIGGPERRNVSVASRSSPELLRKESSADSDSERRDSQLQAKADEVAATKAKIPVVPPAPASARPVVGALSERKAEQDKPAAEQEIRTTLANKKQVLVQSAGKAGAASVADAKAMSRMEAGGKSFDLSDGVWRDESILPDDPQPTVVNMNSRDFEKQRRQLAPYQPVISRPEDVLIKLQNRVYRIQKAPQGSSGDLKNQPDQKSP